MKQLWIGWGLALSMLGAVACGDDGGTGDDDDDDDMSGPVVQVGEYDPATEEIDTSTSMPADFSCLGMARTVGDTEITATLEVANGLDRDQVNTNAPVMILDDNAYADPFVATGRTDGSGVLSFPAFENQLFAFRFRPDGDSSPPGFANSVQYNGIASASRTFEGSSATVQTVMLLPLTVGAQPVSAGNGLISAALEDCNGDDVYGASVRFFRASDGAEIRESATVAIRYFDGVGEGSPTQGRSFTHVDGRYAAINLPGNQDILVGLYGRTSASGSVQLLSCEQFFTLAAASTDNPPLTIATSRPLRPETMSLGCPAP